MHDWRGITRTALLASLRLLELELELELELVVCTLENTLNDVRAR